MWAVYICGHMYTSKLKKKNYPTFYWEFVCIQQIIKTFLKMIANNLGFNGWVTQVYLIENNYMYQLSYSFLSYWSPCIFYFFFETIGPHAFLATVLLGSTGPFIFMFYFILFPQLKELKNVSTILATNNWWMILWISWWVFKNCTWIIHIAILLIFSGFIRTEKKIGKI